MSKAAVIGVVTLSVIGAGVGSFFYAQNAVIKGIDDLFANAVQNEAIDSLTYGGMQVDLLADTVTLHEFKTSMNLASLVSAINPSLNTSDISGTTSQLIEQATISGVWGLLWGGHEIASMVASNITYTSDFSQISKLKTTELTVKSTSTGKIANVTATRVDISALQDGSANAWQMMMMPTAKVTFDDMSVDMVMKTSANTQLQMPAINMNYTVAHALLENISPDYLGLAMLKDMRVSVQLPDPQQQPITFAVGSLVMSDTKIVDMFPVKTTYEIKDAVFNLDGVEDPKVAAFMAVLGLSEINMDMKIAYDADMEARTFSLAPFQIGLKNVGTMDLSVNVTGLPTVEDMKTLQNQGSAMDKAEAERMMADLSLKSIALGYQDKGVLKKFIAAQAMQITHGDVPTLANAYAGQAANIVGATYGPEKASEVAATLAKFLTNPNAVKIALSTDQPIKFSDLQKDVKINGPMALRAFQLEVTAQ